MSARSVVSLWNLAMDAAGTRNRITQVDESTKEAETCRLWYEPVRDQILAAAHWGSCRAVQALGLLSERDFGLAWQPTDPEPPWAFVYAAPSDFLYPRWLDTQTSFEMSAYSNKRAIVTNVEDAILTYTRREDNVSLWEDDLFLAVVYGLAAATGNKLHGKTNRTLQAQQLANETIMNARVRSANENQRLIDHVPDWLVARGVGLTSNISSYIYPYGPLLVAAVTK